MTVVASTTNSLASAGIVASTSLPSVSRLRLPPRTSLLYLTISVVLAASCASDGRELAEPQSWQTTTTRPMPPTSAPPQSAGTTGVQLTSPDFEPGGTAPTDTTCAGANRPPTLSWSAIPDGVAEVAIALSDQTDPTEPLLLWLMTGIDPTLEGIDAGQRPDGAVVTLNDFGEPGYGNPCLENLSSGRRDLQFRLYLLDDPAGVEAAAPGNESWDRVAASATDSATLLMTIDAQP